MADAEITICNECPLSARMWKKDKTTCAICRIGYNVIEEPGKIIFDKKGTPGSMTAGCVYSDNCGLIEIKCRDKTMKLNSTPLRKAFKG